MQNNVFYKHIGDYFMIKRQKLIGFAAIAAFFLLLSCKNNLSPEIPVEDIIISPHNEGEISIVSGMTKNITVKIIPENATNKTLAYSSTPGEVAAIDSSGSIRAGKVGNAVIKITAANGVKREIKVTVVQDQNSVASIEFEEQPADPVELIIGESYELKLKVMPETAANKTLNITSSNDSVAWPNGDGNRWIKADGAVGEATVTITSADNSSIKKEVRFKTKEKPLGPSISIETPPNIETLSVLCESNEDDVTFKVKTLNGKLNYTPEVVGGGKEWANFVSKDGTNPAEDTVRLHLKKNKTVWARTAYIKFKDNNTHNYVKAAGKDLQVKIIQKKNEHPTVTIKWVHGITGPGETEKQPIQIVGSNPGDNHNIDYVFTWNETMETKFFNTRKVDHTHAPNGGFPDGNQCWAKTDANMLHWWFVQNKDNIDQYKTKKAADAVTNGNTFDSRPYEPYYTRGLADDKEHEKSSIANIFREKCINKGGDPANGLNWYLFGLNFGNAKNKNSSPALFKDVFNKDNTPVARVTIRTKKEFEDTLKAGLNSKKAVGLNRYGAQDNTQHAITLWGAAFDEDDNIIAIYVVDNNDVPNRVFTYGIRYQNGVDIYAEPESDQNNPLRFNPYFFNYSSNSLSSNHCIGEIITLDKGEAQWKEWLDKNK